jgi:hypothetical protein
VPELLSDLEEFPDSAVFPEVVFVLESEFVEFVPGDELSDGLLFPESVPDDELPDVVLFVPLV